MIERLTDDVIQQNILKAIIIVAGSGIAGYFLRVILNRAYRSISVHGKLLYQRLLDISRLYVFPLAVIAGFYIGVLQVRSSLTEKNPIHHRVLDYITIGIYVALAIVIARLASVTVRHFLEWYVEGLSRKSGKNLTSTVVPVTTKIIDLLLAFFTLLIVLDHVGVNIGGLVVSLGVGSLAVALAAQETISNMIGWFVIVLDQPFKVGDSVKLSTGEEGQVFSIGFRATRILNADNNLIMIPNGDIAKGHITNLSLPATTTRFLVEVQVAHSANLGEARRILLDLAKQSPPVFSEPAPNVFVLNITDTGILLRLSGQTALDKKFDLETGLRERISAAFAEHHIEFAVPRRIMETMPANGPQTA